ncbi:MAG: sigma-70 family RNA polymerase sigma factor [Gammaproteobacteria bacterium]|nr:MAG: sigma-70 family RNA polymerase sigma factor [Gammaproteobacteria bacterium]
MSGLELLYLDMRGGIASMVSRYVAPDDVDDIVQETYLRLCRVAMVDEIQNPRAYIYRIARNLALDSLKKADNAQTVPFVEDFPEPGARSDDVVRQVESSEEFGHFCDSVRRLPAQARRVFVLKKVYGFSQRRIAADLGISQSTVEKHVALASRRCSRYMRRFDSSGPEIPVCDAR